MSFPTAPRHKPNLSADRPPERRRTRRPDAADRLGKDFYRPRLVVTTGDYLDTKFEPGYN